MNTHHLLTLRYALLPASLLAFCGVMMWVLLFDVGLKPARQPLNTPPALIISDEAVHLIINSLHRRTCANRAPTATTADIKPSDVIPDEGWLLL